MLSGSLVFPAIVAVVLYLGGLVVLEFVRVTVLWKSGRRTVLVFHRPWLLFGALALPVALLFALSLLSRSWLLARLLAAAVAARSVF